MIMSRIIVYEGFLEWYLCIIFVMYKELFIEEIDVYVQMEECMVGMENLKKKFKLEMFIVYIMINDLQI